VDARLIGRWSAYVGALTESQQVVCKEKQERIGSQVSPLPSFGACSCDDQFLAWPGLGTTTCAKCVLFFGSTVRALVSDSKQIVRLSSGVVYKRKRASAPQT
jgi:hypothetical protein